MAWSAANIHCIENFNSLVETVEGATGGQRVAWVACVQELRERFLECYGRHSALDFPETGSTDNDITQAAHSCVEELVRQLEKST